MTNIKLINKENISTFPRKVTGTFRKTRWELRINIPKEQVELLKLRKGDLCMITIEKKR